LTWIFLKLREKKTNKYELLKLWQFWLLFVLFVSRELMITAFSGTKKDIKKEEEEEEIYD
jgi:hypothetical protein